MSTAQLYTDVLKDIEDFYIENSHSVYIPTLNKNLKFKPLSVEQLKKFIELQVSSQKDDVGVLPSLEIVDEINNVIAANCIDHPEDILNKLTILDRDFIIAQLRANSKDTIDINNDDDEFDTYSIKHIVSGCEQNKFPSKLKKLDHTFKYQTGKISLSLRIPTVEHDSKTNTYFKSQVAPLLGQSKSKVKKIIERVLSQTYFVELSKYIDTLEIDKNDTQTVIRFDDPDTITQQLKLLEKLPTDIIVAVSDYVKKLKDYKDKSLYYTDSENKSVPLVIDINLFTTI